LRVVDEVKIKLELLASHKEVLNSKLCAAGAAQAINPPHPEGFYQTGVITALLYKDNTLPRRRLEGMDGIPLSHSSNTEGSRQTGIIRFC
jgi:hypothetical protein